MDNSSRNIVNFIGSITIAALVLMAANYYARSQEPGKPSVETKAVVASTVDELAEDELPSDETAAEDEEIRASDTEVIVESPEGITGDPSAAVKEY